MLVLLLLVRVRIPVALPVPVAPPGGLLQHAHGLVVPAVAGQVEARLAIAVEDVRVRAVLQQQPHQAPPARAVNREDEDQLQRRGRVGAALGVHHVRAGPLLPHGVERGLQEAELLRR